MAAITIPDSVKRYFPQAIDPTHLWVNYNPKADALTVYFTDHPVPSVWEDIDRYVYIGFASDDERRVTGVMIEHFSQWLLVEELKEGLTLFLPATISIPSLWRESGSILSLRSRRAIQPDRPALARTASPQMSRYGMAPAPRKRRCVARHYDVLGTAYCAERNSWA